MNPALCYLSLDVLNLPTRVREEPLFEEEGIPEEVWRSSEKLQHDFSGICAALFKEFGSYTEFLQHIGVEKTRSWPIRIKRCEKDPEKLRYLFEEEGIPEEVWRNSEELKRHGYRRLYIVLREEFGSFQAFLATMEVEENTWVAKVKRCEKDPEKLRYLFEEEGIPEEVWQSSRKLTQGLYKAIFKEFGSFEVFLAVMDIAGMQSDEEFEKISQLSLEEVIAFLGSDPLKLKLYLQNAHPDLSEQEVDRIIIHSFKGLVLGSNKTKEEEYLKYPEEFASITVQKLPLSTEDATITVEGTAPEGQHVYIAGCWNRKVRIQDGRFAVAIPLKQGEENEIRLMAVDTLHRRRSPQRCFTIHQEGEAADDVDDLIRFLDGLSEQLLSDIQNNPGRYEYFKKCAEQLLIKKFSRSFEEGEEHIESLIKQTKNATIRKVLRGVLASFRKIQRMSLPNVQEGSLLFFQKYCAAEIRQRMEVGHPGVILANDPGLGKTRTIEAAVSDREAGIFCPNAVVSAWEEEAAKVLVYPDMLVMRDIPHRLRKEMLRTRKQLRYVTNVQFLQKTSDTERFALLGSDSMVTVHDEAHSRVNEHSEQSKGARMLSHQFQINVTATPVKNPEAVRRMLKILYPVDKRFVSSKAFQTAFPVDNPQSLRALNLLLQKEALHGLVWVN